MATKLALFIKTANGNLEPFHVPKGTIRPHGVTVTRENVDELNRLNETVAVEEGERRWALWQEFGVSHQRAIEQYNDDGTLVHTLTRYVPTGAWFVTFDNEGALSALISEFTPGGMYVRLMDLFGSYRTTDNDILSAIVFVEVESEGV